MNRLICEAINKGRTLELRYHGYSRTVEPHAYGRAEDGNSLLRCFQTSGGSVSGERVGWKLLNTGEIQSVNEAGGTFATRPTYRHNDKAVSSIYCQR